MALIFDNAAGATGSVTTTLKTQSYTVNNGTNGILIVGLSLQGTGSPPTGTAVTYNGVAMTLVPSSRAVNGNHVTELWYLLSPATGAHNIAASWTGNSNVVIGAISYVGVDAVTPLGTANTATGSSTAPSVIVSSATGEVVIDCIVTNSNPTYTAGSGQTKQWDNSSNIPTPNCKGGGSTEAGAASVTMDWTLGSSQLWCISSVAIKPSAAASGTSGNFLLMF